MSIVQQIKQAAALSMNQLYQLNINAADILVNATKPEFEGDYTVVLFPYVKQLRKSPDLIGQELGATITGNNSQLFQKFNVIKGFLNLTVVDTYWINFLVEANQNLQFGIAERNGESVMVEYSSPNTNKPLHLGHLRNNFLGWSIAAILEASGNSVVKTCVVNDRGIHICKSMIAWLRYGNGTTPETEGIKGDHFVGNYYVKFNDVFKAEVEELVAAGMEKETAEKQAPILLDAQKMLQDWEAGDADVLSLWHQMNTWVYAGFDDTYQKIGTQFDKVYYESKTYLLGKDLVEQGLSKAVFYQKPDTSVWIDLTSEGLDEKIVRRKDGTSVYITQDIGLAVDKTKEFGCSKSIYVVGDEQNYHFKVLKLICQKLALPAADGIFHLSYGMVELPSGKMKSREGTVVDADDIIDEMVGIAKAKTEELGKVKDFTPQELADLYLTIGLGALKFFLLRVDPKKKMIFNPEESIEFQGFTGPFIQFIHARIKSILRKVSSVNPDALPDSTQLLLPSEKAILVALELFPSIIQEAANEYDPSKLAIYLYDLSKTFSSFYTELSIANAESEDKKLLRLQLAKLTAHVLQVGMGLLGIQVPERM